MTRISRNIMSLCSALVLGAGLSLSGGMASAQVVLTYSPWLPAGFPLNDAVLRPWMAEVERITEGRVTFNWLPTAVGTASAQFDVVSDGLADMSLVLPGYTPGRFELIELGELPLLSSETAVLGPAFYEYYQAHLEPLRPMPGTHVISLWATIPTHVVSSRGVINSVADFSGLKLRAPSATAVAIMERLGAVPVQRPVSEIYELATTGVVDGSFFPISTTYDFNVAETLSHMTLIPGGLGQSVMMFLINEDRWQEIGAADREAIMAISGAQMAQAAGELFGAAEAAAIARAHAERPDQTVVASDDLRAAIETAIQPVFDSWITRAAARGLADPAAVLQSFRDTLREREAAL